MYITLLCAIQIFYAQQRMYTSIYYRYIISEKLGQACTNILFGRTRAIIATGTIYRYIISIYIYV